MRFLGVQGQDAIGHLFIRHQQGGHGPHTEPPSGFQAMSAVRRPEPVRRRYRDDRIEEQSGRTNGIGQAGGVGFGEIALKRRRYDFLDRE